jgi:hypothetical protein
VYFLGTVDERFKRVQEMKAQHSISKLCEHLLVSTGVFYDRESRQSAPGFAPSRIRHLALKVAAAHAQSSQTYGDPHIRMTLRERSN